MDFVKDMLMKLSDKDWQGQVQVVMIAMLVGSVLGWMFGWGSMGPFVMVLAIVACVRANSLYADKDIHEHA